MPGIEFLSDEPADAAAEELLGRPRRVVPRWVIALLLVLVVGAGVLIAVTRGDRPAPRTPVAATRSSTRPHTQLPPDDHIGSPIDLGRGRPVLDVAIAGVTTWVLQANVIGSINGVGAAASARIPGPSLTGHAAAVARLVLDIPSGVLWVVVLGVKPARIVEYDAVRLQLMRQVTGVGSVAGAAALNGHLYLTSGGRILDIAPGHARATTVGSARGSFGPIIADPARDRLLVSDYGRHTHVWAVRPTAPRNAMGAPATINITKASLAVADGAIWLAGFDTGGGVLMRLDPHTLRPTVHSPLDPILEPGAVLVGSGVVVIWVRDGGGSELRCVDAASGQQLQTWVIDGAVASGGASALVATLDGAVPLELTNCSG